MKAKTLQRLALVGMSFLGLYLLVAWDAAIFKHRTLMMEWGIPHLAFEIEVYNLDHGRYPKSIQELDLDATADEDCRAMRTRILHDRIKTQYQYELLSNSFRIKATSPRAWLHGEIGMEQEFLFGEAMKNKRRK